MSDTAVDPQGINSSEYGHRVRKLIQLINTLVTLGAQTEFDLPRIAVIGNQSAGKSSLVEAITGITVPRDHNTCTRCPMECRMFNSPNPWQCQIFLCRVVDDKGIALTSRQDEPFGAGITDKKDLENMIRRAQLAILNPSVAFRRFVDFDLSTQEDTETPPMGSSKQLPFSQNLIRLDISGPGLTDLTFVDLPGIISVDKDPGIIEVVKNMARRNIEGQTLILTTITMIDDIENQGAAQLARDVDSHGHRTIGVLTKPDLIQPGDHDRWLKILRNDIHPLKHGYYITKQRSTTELLQGISFEEARRREMRFFQNEVPWKDLTQLRSRMGVEELTKALSQLLGAVIQDSLPSLRERSTQLYRDAKDALDKVPPPPANNPLSELLTLVTNFSNDVSRLVEGANMFEQLLRRCRPAYARFQSAIKSTAPDYRPFLSKADAQYHGSDICLFLSEDAFEKIIPSFPISTEIPGMAQVPVVESVRPSLVTTPRAYPYYVERTSSPTEYEADVDAAYEEAPSPYSEPVPMGYGYPITSPASQKHNGIGVKTSSNPYGSFHLSPICPVPVDLEVPELSREGLQQGLSVNGSVGSKEIFPPSSPVYLPEIRSVIEFSITRELPFTVPFRAKSALIKKFFVEWQGHIAQCFNSIYDAALEELKSLARNHFGHAHETGLYGQVVFLIEEHVDESKARVQERLARTLDLDDIPFTQNRQDFGTYRQLYLSKYKSIRSTTKRAFENDSNTHEALRALAKIGFGGLKPHDLVKLRSEDNWEDELVVMAEATSYFYITYKRVIDNIPRVIDQEFLWDIKNKISNAIMQGLELDTTGATEKAQMFLAESETVTKQRNELTEKVRRLGEVHRALINFGG